MVYINEQQKKILEGNLVAFATANKQSIPNLIVVQVNKVINDNQILFTDNYFNKDIIQLIFCIFQHKRVLILSLL